MSDGHHSLVYEPNIDHPFSTSTKFLVKLMFLHPDEHILLPKYEMNDPIGKYTDFRIPFISGSAINLIIYCFLTYFT